MPSVDHPKHGIPFAKQQKIRTHFERSIAHLASQQDRLPRIGTTLKDNDHRQTFSTAIGELVRELNHATGEKARSLTEQVAEVKARLKTKLKMINAFTGMASGEMSFMKTIHSLAESN